MPSAGEGAEHGERLIGGVRLAERRAVEVDQRVRCEDQRVAVGRLRRGKTRCGSLRLAGRQQASRGFHSGAGGEGFIRVGGADLVGEVHQVEDLPPARRSRGKIKFHDGSFSMLPFGES